MQSGCGHLEVHTERSVSAANQSMRHQRHFRGQRPVSGGTADV